MRPSSLTLAVLLFVSIVTSSYCALTDVEIDKYYREFNPPAVHEFKDPYGGGILCVKKSVFEPSYGESDGPLIFKDNLINSCPEGTVEAPKISRENVESHVEALQIKASSSRLLFKNSLSSNRYRSNSTSTPFDDPPPEEDPIPVGDLGDIHEFAVAKQNGQFYAVSGSFDIWQPEVRDKGEGNHEYSSAQIWLAGGSNDEDPGTLETIEVGWHVYPELYRGVDNPEQTRFFVFYSRNNFEDNCFNFDCSNTFPEESLRTNRSDNMIGSRLEDISNEEQRVVKKIGIRKCAIDGIDGPQGWCIYVDDALQGYIPSKFFNQRLGNGYADEVQFGGEVMWIRTVSDEQHTTTDMGNGYWGTADEKRAASIFNVQVFDAPIDNINFNTSPLIDSDTDAGCYPSTSGNSSADPTRFITYGGPGYDSNHPDNCP